MQEVVRQEKKYLLTYLQFRQMEEKLSKVLHADENGQENGYCVRSLYFDTFGDTDFFEKEDGVECLPPVFLPLLSPPTSPPCGYNCGYPSPSPLAYRCGP